jgi:hypothetical protein
VLTGSSGSRLAWSNTDTSYDTCAEFPTSGGHIFAGADNSNSLVTPGNINIISWAGIGFAPSIAGQARSGNMSHKFDVRNGRTYQASGMYVQSDSEGYYCGAGNDFHIYFNGTDTYFQTLVSTGNDIFFRNSSSDDYVQFDSSANEIICEGDITAFQTISDIRKKENIERIDNAVDRLKKIQGITFNYIDKPEKGRAIGVIAQELLEDDILQHAVYETKDGETYGVRYGNLTGFLIEVNKEQQETIEGQQKQLNDQQELINTLIERIEALENRQ